MTVTGVVLAAGSSRRMGHDKLTIVVDGRSLLDHVLDAALRSLLDDVIVVVRKSSPELEIVLGRGMVPVTNRDASGGRATSLRAGIEHIGGRADMVAVLLADEPGIRVPVIDDVIAAARRSAATVLRASYRDRLGHPVVLKESCLAQVDSLRPHTNVQRWLDGFGPIEMVDFPFDAPRDVDVAADLDALELA